jgi:hypothetical protein
MTDTTATTGPVGIGGWLILPAIGLVLTPIRAALSLSEYAGLSDVLAVLSPTQRVFIYTEIAVNLLVLVIAPIVLATLMFRRKRSFRKAYIAWAIVAFAVMVADLVAVKVLFGEALAAANTAILDQETLLELGRSVVLVLIWAPYMAYSKRAQNTFVEP